MTKVDVERIKEKLNSGFTQNAFARDKNGEIVSIDSDEGVCFCVVGACVKLDLIDIDSLYNYPHSRPSMVLNELNDAAIKKHGFIHPAFTGLEISYVNDTYGKDAVFNILDRIAKD